MMPLLKPVRPARLIPGDTIAIAAPASHFDKEKFYRGIAVLERMGFRPFVPYDLFQKDSYFAGSDSHRAGLLNRLFEDRAIKAILCARGGFGSMRILSHLNFKAIRKNPKIFVGFSDISALLSVLSERCGLVTFHGPTLTTLADSDQETRDAMVSAVSSGKRLEIKAKKGVVIKAGSASGPVSGGNLSTLCHLAGTPFQPHLKGHILLIEDRGEAAYRIDRMLTQMKLAGYFSRLAGVALGSFEDGGTADAVYSVVEDIFDELDIPIVAGFQIGHGKTNITIPIGLEATLDAEGHVLSFHKSPVVGLS
jgi:muramoyltetrapeptide carboxypeptidase